MLFRSEKLLETLAGCESDSDMAIEKYSDFVAELFAYSDNLTAVSYTHLDVYKRQQPSYASPQMVFAYRIS